MYLVILDFLFFHASYLFAKRSFASVFNICSGAQLRRVNVPKHATIDFSLALRDNDGILSIFGAITLSWQNCFKATQQKNKDYRHLLKHGNYLC